MKIKAPVALLIIGGVLCLIGWQQAGAPPDHNIGRSIAGSVLQQGLSVLGIIMAGIGAVWLLIRLLSRAPKD